MNVPWHPHLEGLERATAPDSTQTRVCISKGPLQTQKLPVIFLHSLHLVFCCLFFLRHFWFWEKAAPCLLTWSLGQNVRTACPQLREALSTQTGWKCGPVLHRVRWGFGVFFIVCIFNSKTVSQTLKPSVSCSAGFQKHP